MAYSTKLVLDSMNSLSLNAVEVPKAHRPVPRTPRSTPVQAESYMARPQSQLAELVKQAFERGRRNGK